MPTNAPKTTNRTRGALLAAFLGLAMTLAGLTAAGPVSAQGFDCDITITDPSRGGSGAFDILEACATVDDGILDLAIRTRDSARAPWFADVNADGRQYEVRVETPSAEEARALVLDVGTGAIMCEATPQFGGDDGWRSARGIEMSTCFGGPDVTPLHVRWGIGNSDVAPDSGMTLVEEGDGDGDGDPDGDGPLSGGCTTRVVDPVSGGSGAFDIVEACAEYDGFTLDLSVRSRDDARAAFQVDLIAGTRAYTAYTEVVSGQAARAVVEDADTGEVTCEASAAFGPLDGFRHMRNIDVRSCLGGEAQIGLTAVWRIGNSDRAPDSGTTTLVMGEGTDPGNGGPVTPPPPPPGGQPPAPDGLRLAGPDRFATSAQVALYAFPNGAGEVYLARADNPADALSGGSLTLGPVLLVPSCGDIPQPIAEAITQLAPQRVIALGGENAICQELLDAANAL